MSDFVGDYLAGDTGSEAGPRYLRNEFGEYVEETSTHGARAGDGTEAAKLGGRESYQRTGREEFTKNRSAAAPALSRKSAYEQHVEFMQHLRGGRKKSIYSAEGPSNKRRKKKAANADLPERTDYHVLQDRFRFIRDDEDDHKRLSEGDPSEAWEIQLARKYYNRLFKEYALCNLDRYKSGEIGLRWRTKDEVVHGKGQFICANLNCDETRGLHSYEVKFTYKENGRTKRTLVKVRVCTGCALKLFYKKIKKMEKRRKRQSKSSGEIESANADNDEQEKKEDMPDPSLLASDPHQYAQAAQKFFPEDDSKGTEPGDSSNQTGVEEPEKQRASPVEAEQKSDQAADTGAEEVEQKSTEDEMDRFLDSLFV
eukprot:gb/GECG01001408.1/.p1 GENE.gb/GECG01001408.1/~~gb/GECG01001408.1/.p1  ORF type:complete len:369 (+),score=65.73 gb/GECG01001408.1/:1-1107(+)